MTSSKTKKTNKKNKYTIVILAIVAVIGLIVSVLSWISYVNNPNRIKDNAYVEVSRRISVVDLDGEMVHMTTRDDGCHEYTLGFTGGTSCTISGEKMYVSSINIRTNINEVHRLMSRKGWTTESVVSNEIDRFSSDEDRVMWVSYYHKDKDASVTLLAFKRSSGSTGWGRIPATIFNDLKVKLDSDTDYLYGFVASEQYKETKKSFFSRRS
jgi:hypothetical protein